MDPVPKNVPFRGLSPTAGPFLANSRLGSFSDRFGTPHGSHKGERKWSENERNMV